MGSFCEELETLKRRLREAPDYGKGRLYRSMFGRVVEMMHQVPVLDADGVRDIIGDVPVVRHLVTKPYGYPGDHVAIRMLCLDHPSSKIQTGDLWVYAVTEAVLRHPLAVGHRARIRTLGKLLRGNVFGFAAGPALEMRCCSGVRTANLYDNDRRTGLPHMDIVGLVKHSRSRTPGQYDVAYCTGLADYLSDSLVTAVGRALQSLLRPGGEAIMSQVCKGDAGAQAVLQWPMTIRSEDHLQRLLPDWDIRTVDNGETNLLASFKTPKSFK